MKITIITAVYNRAITVEHAIRSVRSQSYPNVEHIVIDGGSTDETVKEILKHDRPQMRVVSEPDDGIYDALNKGIDLASGEIIGLMHSDDFFANDDVLEKVAQAFSDPHVDAVYGDLDYVSASDVGRVIRHWQSGAFSREKLLRGWMPPHPTLHLRRRVFDRLGKYDTSYRIAADYEAVLRYLGKGGVQTAYIPEVLVKMRVGGESNRSLSRMVRKSREDYRALRSTDMGGIRALTWKNLSKIPQFFFK